MFFICVKKMARMIRRHILPISIVAAIVATVSVVSIGISAYPQELSDEENRSYMEIHSVKDIKNVMEQTFSSNRRMIRYVYEHVDIFRLLLTSSSGTEYDNFVEKLAKEEAANTMEFFDKCSQYIDNTEKISEGLIKQISHFVVSSIFDGLLEDKTEDEVVRETELSSEFCLAGMKHFLNIS